jgi:hypothetical protein
MRQSEGNWPRLRRFIWDLLPYSARLDGKRVGLEGGRSAATAGAVVASSPLRVVGPHEGPGGAPETVHPVGGGEES